MGVFGWLGARLNGELGFDALLGGGGLMLAWGIACALFEAQRSGQGQVIDAAMCEGTLNLLMQFQSSFNAGRVSMTRASNQLDGGAHYYNVYACADGKHIAVGAIEPQFYAELRRLVGLDDPAFGAQLDREVWPALRERLALVFRERTRDEWAEILEGTDACVARVLTLEEASKHAHLSARGSFMYGPVGPQPTPAPRFSRHAPRQPEPPPTTPREVSEILSDWAAR